MDQISLYIIVTTSTRMTNEAVVGTTLDYTDRRRGVGLLSHFHRVLLRDDVMTRIACATRSTTRTAPTIGCSPAAQQTQTDVDTEPNSVTALLPRAEANLT